MSSFLKIKIPEDWKLKKFKDCIQINPENLNLNNFKDDFINYIDISGIDNSIFQIKDITKIPIKEIPSRARRIVKHKDVIISTVRPYLKAFSKVKKRHNNFICSTGFAVLRVKDGLNHNYLFQWILYQKFVNYMISQMVGSSYPAVNMSDIKLAPILLPPIKEQIKISSILSNIDKIITITQKIIEDLTFLKKGLMQRLFTEGIGHTEFKETKLGKIPKEWEIKKLNEISEIKGRIGWRGYNRNDFVGENEGPISLGVKNISDKNRLVLDEIRYIKKEKYEESPEIIANYGDIIITQRGSIGKLTIIDKKLGELTINPNILLIKNIKVNNYFLYYILTSPIFQQKIINYASKTTISLLTQEQVKAIKIPLPKREEQNKMSSILNCIDNLIDNEINYLKILKITRKGLMQDLLTGKKRVKLDR